MAIQLLLYKLWTRVSAWVDGYLGQWRVTYLNSEARKKAEQFLLEFRAGKPRGWWVTADPRRPKTWPKRAPADPTCKHLKGGNRTRATVRDYNLACHRFIDGRAKIWCLNNCGYAVWSTDVENFKTAWDLFDGRSSNSVTCSERPFAERRTHVTVQDGIPESVDGRA